MKADREFYSELEDIHYKYERMESLVSVLQQFVSECVDIAGAPENAVSNSLYEVELGLRDANEKMNSLINQGILIRKEDCKTNK